MSDVAEAGARPGLRGRLLRAIVALSGTTLLTQLMSIVTTPIQSRLYGPEQYGAYGASMAVVAPATQAATLQLQSAIVVTPRDEDAHALAAAAITSGTIAAVVALGLALAIGPEAPGGIGLLATLGALAVLMNALGGVAAALVNRRKAYSVLAGSRLAAAIVGSGLNISLGFLGVGWWGLLVGYISAAFVAASWCLRSVRSQWSEVKAAFRVRVMRATLLKFRQYPLLVLPTELLNTFIRQAPIYVLTLFATIAAVGSYNLAQSMLGLPMSLVGSAVAEVFSREAAEQYAKTGECSGLFRKTALALTALAVPALALIAALGPFVFVLVFGPRWRTAGEFVRIMATPVALRLIASPLSTMYIIAGRQREDLIIHLGLAVAIVASGIVAHFLGVGAHGLVVLTSAATSAFYGLIFVRSWRFARGSSVVDSIV